MNCVKLNLHTDRDAIYIDMVKLIPIILAYCTSLMAYPQCVDMPREAKRGISAQIVHGDPALRPIPYQVALNLIIDGENLIWCGGTIIGRNFVLTAMHCFDQNPYQMFTVAAGAYTIVQTKSETGSTQLRRIKRLHFPLGYNNRTRAYQRRSEKSNDIAIIELDEPFEFNENVGPACLPNAEQMPRSGCLISGWGKVESLKYPRVLQRATVSVFPLEECGYDLTYLNANMVCAGGNNKDSCQADSGGPLVCEHSGKAVVVGITSWGKGCGLDKVYGVYTNVHFYLDFILTVMNGGQETVDIPPERCTQPDNYKDLFCDDDLNVPECDFDGGDCCGFVNPKFCRDCTCKE